MSDFPMNHDRLYCASCAREFEGKREEDGTDRSEGEEEETMITIWNMRTQRVPDGAVPIGRGTPFGNPFLVADHGRQQAIALFRLWLWRKRLDEGRNREAIAEIAALHGKDLACFCAPRPCHGEVLVKAAAWCAAQLKR